MISKKFLIFLTLCITQLELKEIFFKKFTECILANVLKQNEFHMTLFGFVY